MPKKKESKDSQLTGADLLFNRLKECPEDIIAWCEREIAEYKKLIKLIKGKKK